jgi:hypothetical protein
MNHLGILIGFMLLTLMTTWSGAAESPDIDPALRTRLYADPPATGMLITRLLPGGTAAESGLKPGDIIISYNGTVPESLAQFSKLVGSAPSDTQITILVLRGPDQQALQVPGGKLGIIITPVKKGVPNAAGKINDLPEVSPATDLNLEVLKSHPHLESWYTLYFDDQPVGALYLDVLARGKYIQWTCEKSCIKVNSEYPRGHYISRMLTTFSDHPEFIRSDETNVLSGTHSLQSVRRFDAGKKYELRVPNDTGQNSLPFSLDPQEPVLCRLVAIEMLQFMPLAKDRCIHFQYFNISRYLIEQGALHIIDVDSSRPDAKESWWNAEAVFQGEVPILGTLDGHGHLVRGTYATLAAGPLTYKSSSEAAATAVLDGKLSMICPFDAPDHLHDDDLMK